MLKVQTKIDSAGRVNITSRQRQALGLKKGDPVTVTVVDDELRIRSVEQAWQEVRREAQALLRGYTVDDFIAERREEAAREEAKLDAMSDDCVD